MSIKKCRICLFNIGSSLIGSSLFIVVFFIGIANVFNGALQVEGRMTNINCTLVPMYPKWLQDKYSVYVEHVNNFIYTNTTKPESMDYVYNPGVERLVQSPHQSGHINPNRFTDALHATTQIGYYVDVFNKKVNVSNSNNTCVISDEDQESLKYRYTPDHYQLIIDKIKKNEIPADCSIKTQCSVKNLDAAYTRPYFLWAEKVVFVDWDFPDDVSTFLLIHVLETIMYMTCLKFLPRESAKLDTDHFVKFRYSDEYPVCNATISMAGTDSLADGSNFQNMYINPDCYTYPIMLNLILTSLGSIPEHLRFDRDDFIAFKKDVDVDRYSNIDPVWYFERIYTDGYPLTPYNVHSIMHVGHSAWKYKNDTDPNTVKLKNPELPKDADFNMPYYADIYDFARINYLYGCMSEETAANLTSLYALHFQDYFYTGEVEHMILYPDVPMTTSRRFREWLYKSEDYEDLPPEPTTTLRPPYTPTSRYRKLLMLAMAARAKTTTEPPTTPEPSTKTEPPTTPKPTTTEPPTTPKPPTTTESTTNTYTPETPTSTTAASN